VKISDLVPEGTLVDSGDYIATLDRTEITTRLTDIGDQLMKAQSQLTKTQLDTSLELRGARDNLINLKYALEECQITLEQSKYESPAAIRQATINLEKAERTYKQAVESYQLKVQQNKAKMKEVEITFQQQQRERNDILGVLDKFIVKAPKSGMVIYVKEWGGSKRKVGTELSTWDPVVATLPDLTSMISKTYINEIDISKVKAGQDVKIKVDAFPEKEFAGKITEVANVGENLPNTDAKVFEVLIKVNGQDTLLRPAMTTSNSVITAVYDSVVFVPLECIHNNDSLTFVFSKDGGNITRQIVETGESNENIIKKGLNENDLVLLTIPDKPDRFEFSGLDIYREMKNKELERKKEEAEKQKSAESKKVKSPGPNQFDKRPPGNFRIRPGGNFKRQG
jgi:multidrug efflux pump subunit AcrA (membrane-fusion protein)